MWREAGRKRHYLLRVIENNKLDYKLKATIDKKIISTTINSFPDTNSWQNIELSELSISGIRLSWTGITSLKGKGGVYAWAVPSSLFKSKHSIRLHGPIKSGQVDFEFTIRNMPKIKSNRRVVYFGRTTYLFKRLQQHLRPSGKTTFQVGKGLKNCGLAKAKGLMVEHARFHYTILSGSLHSLNRDLIEAAMYSKYYTPFNVKSEH